jgi:proteic killer suppression protein
MIGSFGDPATADLYHGRPTSRVRRFPRDILPAALRKLNVLNSGNSIQDLRAPPGNPLGALIGKLKEKYIIRVNNQWRFILEWSDNSAHQISLIDYH